MCGRVRTQRVHGRGNDIQIVDAQRQLTGFMPAVTDGDFVEEVEEMTSLGFELCGELHDRKGSRYSVLIPGDVGGHAVSESFLDAENQIGNLAEPLEGGESLLTRLAVCGGR